MGGSPGMIRTIYRIEPAESMLLCMSSISPLQGNSGDVLDRRVSEHQVRASFTHPRFFLASMEVSATSMEVSANHSFLGKCKFQPTTLFWASANMLVA